MVFLNKVEPEGKSRSRGPKRLWVLPPVPRFSAREIEGLRTLEEVPGGLGCVLFQCFRDVHLWITCRPRSRRAVLFPDYSPHIEALRAAGSDEDIRVLRSALDTFRRLVLTPLDVDSRLVARACAEISGWASERGADSTAAGFALLAAQAARKSSEYAFLAGRAERRLARYERATELFERAVGLARRAGDETAYATAYLGWAYLEDQRGRPSAARSFFDRAWKAALRGNVRGLAGAARHGMLTIATGAADFDEGYSHAVAAYKLYENDRSFLPRLAHDTGALLSAVGYFSVALRLYEVVYPFLVRTDDRLAVLSNLGRASSALGNVERFTWALDEVTREAVGREGALTAAALAEIAQGARTAGMTPVSLKLASEALRMAHEVGAPLPARAAFNVLDGIQQNRPTDQDRPAPGKVSRFVGRFCKQLKTLRTDSS